MKVHELIVLLGDRNINKEDPVVVWSEEWGALNVTGGCVLRANEEHGLPRCFLVTTEDPELDLEDDNEDYTNDDETIHLPKTCDEDELEPTDLSGRLDVEEAT